ncbi:MULTISPECIES: FAD-dependent oxidoreductase [Rhodococcus]|uniref:ferredoxin--NADP(+) reductase n=1 Tax=Rhodococcus oxybenzonivorans TaxID=1990687 RepID=A0AAE4V545_9NOCA|nr:MULTISPECIES: FAD-dependent oxidoreductase [Rhodococcus]MDV7242677.1 FAD-dependent oxidoreductase [Rhodococcus oxybenzonivorans]MDV7268585.1 FAD-dependent oxidoreductase [Rhodococcus oxybenzonivorans]MDV7276110.1 FAD-dependent oxidoreductase [Rhodococcus oxybenzonivorans]MDV7332165.1 FAD-dependent oxidoreductase [Rhodococcus oxybenzonivorans]MDV7344370.1 FAD-dependent oxidoreductase [Rhodococcus oxybenzonivorans]
MSFVVTQPCCNDATCVAVCPVNCIRPTPDDPAFRTTEMLYIDPQTCIDCGACMEACPVEAIYPEDELPDDQARYRDINAEYFRYHPLDSALPSPDRQHPVKVSKPDVPLRVAVVGSGPAGVYAAAELMGRMPSGSVEIEMFDRLPTPWGLVRAGVAPDHLATKTITEVFRKIAAKPGFRFHLNVEIGRHLTHHELLDHHHAVVYAVGALDDRKLDIPGTELPGSAAAPEFVAWYNGHPDYAHRTFDLGCERAVIVGNGNVALDVARLLVTDPDDLVRTDMAEHAVDALRKSNIREVVVLGRRGSGHAAYTTPELLALGRIRNVDVVVDRTELDLGETTESTHSFSMDLKTSVAREFANSAPNPAHKRIVLRYLASPTRILGDERVEGVEIVRNELVRSDHGTFEARATDDREILEAGLVLRSIGFRGRAVPAVPFDNRLGIIPNVDGRVVDPDTNSPVSGVYTTGWVKRGPSGVIGTNKHCAHDTVTALIDDVVAGRLPQPKLAGDREALTALVRERQPEVVDRKGWLAIDAEERSRGREQGRPRVKFTDINDMLDAARTATQPAV